MCVCVGGGGCVGVCVGVCVCLCVCVPLMKLINVVNLNIIPTNA